MLQYTKDFLKAQEVREALQLYWLEIMLWPLLAWTGAFLGFAYGLLPGLGLTGLVLLSRLRPEVTRLVSPDGRRTLVDCRWSFGRVFYLASVVTLAAGAGRVLPAPGLAAALFLSLAILLAASALIFMFVIPFLMLYCVLWAFHLVLIREGGRTRSWHVRLCVSQTAATEYLWLPDGESLLVAQSDEDDCWYLYVYELNERGPGARHPYNIVVGHYPHLRRVTLEEARSRVAPFLHDCAPLPAVDIARPGSPPTPRDYSDLCRRFFVWFNPQCVNN